MRIAAIVRSEQLLVLASWRRQNGMNVLLYSITAGVCFAFSLYALSGVWQAAAHFAGDRAMTNYLFWGPLLFIFFAAAIFCGYRALRLSLLSIKTRVDDDVD
ncbi:MAG: hypothetical protein OES46_04440 [Gammaproteobacteria bacterium]|jgi:hypothetical protein|nr:hypothetical protein [Gammaproteobacteria bacterium]